MQMQQIEIHDLVRAARSLAGSIISVGTRESVNLTHSGYIRLDEALCKGSDKNQYGPYSRDNKERCLVIITIRKKIWPASLWGRYTCVQR